MIISIELCYKEMPVDGFEESGVSELTTGARYEEYGLSSKEGLFSPLP